MLLTNEKGKKAYMDRVIAAYAAMHIDDEVRLSSQSGGAFSAISDLILQNKGVVYGCALDEDNRAVHIRAVSKDERNMMRGSKYVQSNMGDCFQSVAHDLKEGRTVMFTGTSCQVDGLSGFLSAINWDFDWRSKLVLVDIVCHGVPSPLILKDYLQYLGEKYQGDVKKFNFRNKRKYGWQSHIETFSVNGKEYQSGQYTRLFYSHYTMRPACFCCPYKQVVHRSDLTIADCWGVDRAAEGYNDNKGTSLILVQTSLGEEIFEKMRSKIKTIQVDLNLCMQEALQKPWKEPAGRKKFWADYHTEQFEWIIKRYGVEPIPERLKNSVLRALRKTRNMLRKGWKRN